MIRGTKSGSLMLKSILSSIRNFPPLKWNSLQKGKRFNYDESKWINKLCKMYAVSQVRKDMIFLQYNKQP